MHLHHSAQCINVMDIISLDLCEHCFLSVYQPPPLRKGPYTPSVLASLGKAVAVLGITILVSVSKHSPTEWPLTKLAFFILKWFFKHWKRLKIKISPPTCHINACSSNGKLGIRFLEIRKIFLNLWKNRNIQHFRETLVRVTKRPQNLGKLIEHQRTLTTMQVLLSLTRKELKNVCILQFGYKVFTVFELTHIPRQLQRIIIICLLHKLTFYIFFEIYLM